MQVVHFLRQLSPEAWWKVIGCKRPALNLKRLFVSDGVRDEIDVLDYSSISEHNFLWSEWPT